MISLSTPGRSTRVAIAYAFHTDLSSFTEEQITPLMAAQAVHDAFAPDLADRLEAVKIPVPAAHILAIAPLAQAAWATENLTPLKRDLALKAASLKGIKRHSTSYQLLEAWMTRRPDASLFAVWHDYVGALTWVLSEEDLNSLRTITLERCRAILRATSGCFGLTNQTGLNSAMLNKIKAAFEVSLPVAS